MKLGFYALIPVFALSVPALGQTFPDKPFRVIIGQSPGTSTDIGARVLGRELATRLGQPFVVDNRIGADGTIAAVAVVSAPSDGYTLYYGGTPSLSPVF